MTVRSSLFAAGLLAAGVAVAGAFVGWGFWQGREAPRVVSVKGLAERPVSADLALWPLRFVATGDSLAEVQAVITADAATVRDFLETNGIGSGEIQVKGLEVIDVLAQPYRSGPVDVRFIVAQTLLVRSTEVQRVFEASQKVGDLVNQGVVISSEDMAGGSAPIFLFTRLNDVKPAMIAEATANARATADQFARDSGSRLGAIQTASQGLFQILPRDPAPGIMEERQIDKTLRVVTTVDYRLTD
ncbi:SIMPL domain-containing protein [Caenispirillum bisanense]|uniref:SIMPL domain-containing protein n=1 Tax=Caenispirillum bisanense TaxID=414052 RepID=UPI0031D09A54